MLEETSLKSRPISLTRKVFMPHLETLIGENRTWAHDTGLDNMKWEDLLYILNAIWRRFKLKNTGRILILLLGCPGEFIIII